MTAPGLAFAAGFAGLAALAALAAGALPVGVSVGAVALFAGPHNWLEARYVLGRLPARVGKLRSFFVLSATGIAGLTLGFAALAWAADAVEPWLVGAAYATWGTALVFWAAALVVMRSRTNPRFDGGWAWPLAFLVTAGVWACPAALAVGLVYLHPLMALVLLDRELGRSRRAWRPAYRRALLAVPVSLVGLWLLLGDAPGLPGADPVSAAVAYHAGAGFVPGVSSHFLVAAHAFLEVVHYGAWVVLIPLVGLRGRPWAVGGIPAARRGRTAARVVGAVLLVGLLVVVALWAGFAADYGTTRTIYFTAAVAHVLAEFPFLLRVVWTCRRASTSG